MAERIGLTSREYKALRMVFGIVNGFEICAPEIEKRADMTEHGAEGVYSDGQGTRVQGGGLL